MIMWSKSYWIESPFSHWEKARMRGFYVDLQFKKGLMKEAECLTLVLSYLCTTNKAVLCFC